MAGKKGIIVAIVLAALAIGAALAYVEYIYPKVVEPAETYSEARSLYGSGNYMQSALKLESISSYMDSKQLAKQAWKLAGDSAYNEGNFDMASACYIKAGSNEEDIARMDDCYLRLAENAFAKSELSRGEVYLSCVLNPQANAERIDKVRINAAKLLLGGGLTDENIDNAIERLEPCSENAKNEITDMLLEWGDRALDSFNLDAASSLFAAATRFCPENRLASISAGINDSWTAAGNRALLQGLDAIAQRCFAISGHVPEIENAEENYQKALDMYAKGDLFGAFTLFRRLGSYQNSMEMAEALAERIRLMPAAGAQDAYAILDSDGAVQLVGDGWGIRQPEWTDLTRIAVGKTPFILGLTQEGMVVSAGKDTDGCLDTAEWSNIIQIACGESHSIGLCADGTVVFAGTASSGKNSTLTWRNIVSIAAGYDSCYGVLQNGIVVATGDNSYGQCDVSRWDNIKMVSAGGQHAVGLRKDGTVVACGDNTYGQCEVESWTDVVFVSAGEFHTVALRSDGTLLACGRNDNGECAVGTFREVAAVSAGASYTLMLFENGTYRAIGRAR